MSQLPLEILLHICSFADNDALSRLCIANCAIYNHVLPLLYMNVRLVGTRKVEQFNDTMKSTPEIGHFVHSITVEDPYAAAIPDTAFCKDIDSHSSLQIWSQLFKNMAHLSRHKRLSLVALSREVCERVWHTDSLGYVIRQSDFVLDEIVVCHWSLEFLLKRMDVRRATWYTCTGFIGDDSYSVEQRYNHYSWGMYSNGYISSDGDSEIDDEERDKRYFAKEDKLRKWFAIDYFPFKRLREIRYMIGDSSKVLAEVADDTSLDYFYWANEIFDYIDALWNSQPEPVKFTISLHVRTPAARTMLEEESLEDDKYQVNVGYWGRLSDKCQLDAEAESFARRDWQQDNFLCLDEKADKYRAKAIQGDKEGEGRDWWCPCRAPYPREKSVSHSDG
jgi:hypothetical protein